MSLFEERKGNITQENFQAGKKKIYLRNKDRPESIRIENAKLALDYLREKTNHYSDVEHKIVMMLPPMERDLYLSKRVLKISEIANNYVSSLSEAKEKKEIQDEIKKLQTSLQKIQEKLQVSITPTTQKYTLPAIASPNLKNIKKRVEDKKKSKKKRKTKDVKKG